MGAHPLLVRAAKCVEQARALNDEFEDKTRMPKEVAQRIDGLLTEASSCKRQVEREARLQDLDSYLHEPDYKHDMSTGDGAGSFSAAGIEKVFTTDRERKEAQQAAFLMYVRKGYLPPEAKADLVENSDGELLVPADYAGTILQDLPNDAVLRPLAFVRPTSSNRAEVGVVHVASAGWGKLESGDTAPDGLGGAPDVETIRVHDLNALVKIGVDELDDADGDLEAVIRNALSLKVAEQEDYAFAAGTGDTNKQPLGVASATSITQGINASAAGVVKGDEVKALQYEVPQWARKNGVYVGSTSAEKEISLLKDAEGRYLLQPNAAAGEPPTLFGYRWYTCDGLPEVNTTGGTKKAVVFGDWRQGYMIADRRRLTVQRLEERFATEGKIGLLFRHRVGGGVIRPKAFAFYKV
ncbi:phage major capsid protein [Streptomyces sp. NPDC127105]|uniref:phage major capsid protein n=1 Tax=Streptomyces sp. NPDC127105 TaxID=3345359 RepID=UPI00365649EE